MRQRSKEAEIFCNIRLTFCVSFLWRKTNTKIWNTATHKDASKKLCPRLFVEIGLRRFLAHSLRKVAEATLATLSRYQSEQRKVSLVDYDKRSAVLFTIQVFCNWANGPPVPHLSCSNYDTVPFRVSYQCCLRLTRSPSLIAPCFFTWGSLLIHPLNTPTIERTYMSILSAHVFTMWVKDAWLLQENDQRVQDYKK